MKSYHLRSLVVALTTATMAATVAPVLAFDWQVVANNGDLMPTTECDLTAQIPSDKCRNFNSYNQPSVNANGLVVIRARSKGGQGLGQPVHGVYTRDMATAGKMVKILDRKTSVPQPNNRDSVFIEPPSFPRVDIWSDTIATRGNHQPVWQVLEDGEIVEQLGTTGIYTNPYENLITGASKLGSVPEFSFFQVPEAPAGTPFDVFPGSPAVADGNTIAFKGNYTVNLVGKTGVYYRKLENQDINGGPGGGTNPVVLIANNTSTLIPDTATVFGSTAPPSAADGQVVFAGFDNEEHPTKGGIYLAKLTGSEPALTTLVSIGSQVPGENKNTKFSNLGEGVSFDGRFVAFWGAWGAAIKTLDLQCPTEGNADRIAFCNQLCEENQNNCIRTVPLKQGIFVHDTKTRNTFAVAKTSSDFNDFVYWNFSGRVPGTGEGDDDDGELARWRSNSFVAVSGSVDGNLTDATVHTAFKARTGQLVSGAYVDPVDGIYLRKGPGQSPILTLVETGMNGTQIDPEAVYVDEDDPNASPVSLPITEMGIERDGFRGNKIAINLSMGTEEAGWAGVYLTEWR